jgi:hypothetical protein
MKTSLMFLAFAFAATLALASAASFAGLPVPSAFDAVDVFAGYVAVLALMIAFADYSPARRLPLWTIASAPLPAGGSRSSLATAANPLAA